MDIVYVYLKFVVGTVIIFGFIINYFKQQDSYEFRHILENGHFRVYCNFCYGHDRIFTGWIRIAGH